MSDQPGTGWAPNVSATPGVGVCSKWSTYSTNVQTYALRLATRVIWTATGRLYGLDNVVVRPSRPAQNPLYRTYPVGFAGYGFWTLFGINGGTAFQIASSCGCGSSSAGANTCACGAADISLPDDVASITNVTVDGVTVDPSAYILLGGYLTRTDGKAWPFVQDFSLPLGSVGTWSVTYSRGLAVPADLNDAAGLYACQLGAALTGGQCALPNRVQSITRTGLDIQLVDPGDYLRENRTGYDMVDMILNSYNPYGLTQRTRVVSLDMPQFRR